ncbi:MAG: orotidine-5'-phosphate decarboxylase [Luminiphilus sp.]|nr:orotidine-5'-phosphate decarboxylase [Luminiphilus sp.]
MSEANKPLVVALDYDDLETTLRLVDQLDPATVRLKVGKQLFTRVGPPVVQQLVQREFDVFLDLKFHDIPNTVAHAVAAAADLGVWMVNVHASGGSNMMRAARDALGNRPDRPLLTAVTVLTRMADEDLEEVGFRGVAVDRVLALAKLAAEAGLDGVVCSAHEATRLRGVMASNFSLVTPGIRLSGDAAGDQKRIVDPVEALRCGADYLVMGRSITGADNPRQVVEAIISSLQDV